LCGFVWEVWSKKLVVRANIAHKYAEMDRVGGTIHLVISREPKMSFGIVFVIKASPTYATREG
jgi:hypothetical protein